MLHYNTVNDLLRTSLLLLMSADEFTDFRLVGGTALSLQLGHRESIDLDLFSDITYGEIDFDQIEQYLSANFHYVDHSTGVFPGFGKSYFIGSHKDNAIKLDIFYTDAFIQPAYEEDSIRMASVEEIVAMKIDVIQRGARKKDFWDLHELMDSISIDKMLRLHEERYPYAHDKDLILNNFTSFTQADEDFNPICLKGKFWEFIKEDIEEAIKNHLL